MSDFLSFLADNPTLRLLQFLLLSIAVLAVFFVLFTTRDILLRSRSFLFQVACILLVACVPVLGFFFYLLIRPSRTLKDREMERMLADMAHTLGKKEEKEAPEKNPKSEELKRETKAKK